MMILIPIYVGITNYLMNFNIQDCKKATYIKFYNIRVIAII